MLAAEPIESSEATEPTEPIDKIDPADPIDKMDPAEPIDKIDPLEPMLRMDPDEPIERGAPSLLRMGSFSQPGRSSGPQVPAGGDAHPYSRLDMHSARQILKIRLAVHSDHDARSLIVRSAVHWILLVTGGPGRGPGS